MELFKFYSKTRNFSANSHTMASMLLSGMISLNFIVLWKSLLNFKYVTFLPIELSAIIIFLFANVMNFYTFLKDEKYKELIYESSNWSVKRRKVNSGLTITYILLTIALLIIV